MSIKCRRTLDGIKCGDPTAGPGADVDEPAASLQRRCDDVDASRNLRKDTLDGGGDSSIFGIDDACQLQG